MKDVSIILPNYTIDAQVEAYLEQCLDALERTTDMSRVQFIVIDNGSPNESARLKALADIYIRKDYPMGYARAVNAGFALADCEWIVVLNNDLFLQDGWLDKMIEVYNETPGGVLAPYDYPMSPGPVAFDTHWYSLILMRRSVQREVGYFDESMNFRFHDQDYSIRVKQAGFEVMRTPNVVVAHINSATYSKMPQRSGESAEMARMVKKWGATMFEDWVRSYVR
jgi:GT2 family glycosyltransferase